MTGCIHDFYSVTRRQRIMQSTGLEWTAMGGKSHHLTKCFSTSCVVKLRKGTWEKTNPDEEPKPETPHTNIKTARLYRCRMMFLMAYEKIIWVNVRTKKTYTFSQSSTWLRSSHMTYSLLSLRKPWAEQTEFTPRGGTILFGLDILATFGAICSLRTTGYVTKF